LILADRSAASIIPKHYRQARLTMPDERKSSPAAHARAGTKALWPARIETEEQLEEVLTRPSLKLIQSIKQIASPLLILGAGGKMGPTLAVLAKRAAEAAGHKLNVVAVSRFSDSRSRSWLESRGIGALCRDLLERTDVTSLPDCANLIYLVGLKFGTAQNPAATWAANTIVASLVMERYPSARIVALSTGNVYPLSEVRERGSTESAPLTPLGEYANAAVGRERIFEYYCGRRSTPVALLRLFYAVELRYGVLVDIAKKVQAREPIELANGHFNCIWQGDANEMILRALSLSSAPPAAWNLCRPEIFSVREVAEKFGELLAQTPRFAGTEACSALLGNPAKICKKLGPPAVPIETMLGWTADWVKQGGRSLGKATHFEVRNGRY
jgi:nucleoside-diphosphate-sugar epimerase